MDCDTCTYADEHGQWPGDMLRRVATHCSDTAGVKGCHRTWTGKAQSHCTACHRHFGSNTAGDAHRVKGVCRDPKGFDRWETPDGPVWGGHDPKAMLASAAKAREGGAPPAPTPERI